MTSGTEIQGFQDLLTQFLSTPPGQIAFAIGTEATATLVKASRSWIKERRWGKPEQRAVNDASKRAFAALYYQAYKSFPHNPDMLREAISVALQWMLNLPGVSDRLLNDALTATALDFAWLHQLFQESGAGQRLIHMNFDLERCFGAWHVTLVTALRDLAKEDPLFRTWTVANLADIAGSLAEIKGSIAVLSASQRPPGHL